MWQRRRPYIRRPGAACLIPGTTLVARFYPKRIEVEGVGGVDVDLSIDEFSFFLDLDRGWIEAGGVRFEPLTNGLIGGGIQIGDGEKLPRLCRGEHLYLGVDKQLDWDRVTQRADLREVLPIWLRLAQISPSESVGECLGEGNADVDLLEEPLINAAWSRLQPVLVQARTPLRTAFPRGKVKQRRTMHGPKGAQNRLRGVDQRLLEGFRCGFTDLMVPKGLPHLGYDGQPGIDLLKSGGAHIRSLFVVDRGLEIDLLPTLPFVCGRFSGVQVSAGELDIEWTKKRLRTVTFRGAEAAEIWFVCPKGIKRYRCRGSWVDAGSSITVSKGEVLLLDRFEK